MRFAAGDPANVVGKLGKPSFAQQPPDAKEMFLHPFRHAVLGHIGSRGFVRNESIFDFTSQRSAERIDRFAERDPHAGQRVNPVFVPVFGQNNRGAGPDVAVRMSGTLELEDMVPTKPCSNSLAISERA